MTLCQPPQQKCLRYFSLQYVFAQVCECARNFAIKTTKFIVIVCLYVFFRGVAVITSDQHAECLRYNPGRKQFYCFIMQGKRIQHIPYKSVLLSLLLLLRQTLQQK